MDRIANVLQPLAQKQWTLAPQSRAVTSGGRMQYLNGDVKYRADLQRMRDEPALEPGPGDLRVKL
jgi:hypothetical protein